MKPRLSTGMTLVLVFTLLLALSQWVAYLVSSELLRTAVQEREIDKIKSVGRVVQGLLARQADRVEEVTRLLSLADDMQASLLNAGTGHPKHLTVMLDEVHRFAKLDLLEVTDDREVVVYRAQDPERKGDRDTSWGVAEAMAARPCWLVPVVQRARLCAQSNPCTTTARSSARSAPAWR